MPRVRKPTKPRRHNKGIYRSGLEKQVSDFLKKKKIPFKYEESKIDYVVPESTHKYTPDFEITTKSGKTIFIETKGIWDATDRKKHLLIREQHPELDIRLVFTNARAKIRKGSKTTYADICEGRGRAPFKGVTWKYATRTIPKEWLEE